MSDERIEALRQYQAIMDKVRDMPEDSRDAGYYLERAQHWFEAAEDVRASYNTDGNDIRATYAAMSNAAASIAGVMASLAIVASAFPKGGG